MSSPPLVEDNMLDMHFISLNNLIASPILCYCLGKGGPPKKSKNNTTKESKQGKKPTSKEFVYEDSSGDDVNDLLKQVADNDDLTSGKKCMLPPVATSCHF